MFTWTSRTQPRHGDLEPYAQAVADFNVDAFADMVADTGAAYVMFTANHSKPTFPAPLACWESLYPGFTTERDLVDELIDALDARGTKFFLYLNLFIAYRHFGPNDCADDFLDSSCRLLEEIGKRYGKRLAGYWIDSCNGTFKHFGSVPMEPIFRATKAGNPDRLCCFNWGFQPVGTPWQDYWSAETVSPGILPAVDESGRMVSGPGKGLNGHALLIMDDFWVHDKPDTEIVSPRWRSAELIDFIRDCNEKKAPVTLNLGIYQDGTISPAAAEVMRELRRALR
jgi:alpha-L-fucosidase